MTPFPHTAVSVATARRSTLGQMVEESTMLLMACVGTLIFVLALLILFHENANATKGYKLRSLERQRSALLLEEEIVNMQVAKQQAIETLQLDPHITGMIVVRSAGYIEPDQTVALRPVN